MELFSLWEQEGAHILHRQITGSKEDLPFALRYRVHCDEAWCTREAWLELDTPPQLRELRITIDQEQRWTLNGARRPELDGLFDVDMQVSPSTNTLPLRRLGIVPGKSYAVTAAWIKVPSFEIEPIQQQYTCIDAHHLRYRSGTFAAEIEVDAHGLVEHYGSFWQRMRSA